MKLRAETAQVIFWAIGSIAQLAAIWFYSHADVPTAAPFQVVAIVATWAANYAGTKKNPHPPLSVSELAAAIRRELKDDLQHIQLFESIETEKYPGLAVNLVGRFHRIADTRRKYIFDMGHDNSAHFSLYFDPRDILCFSFTDMYGESYSVRTSSAVAGFRFDDFVLLTCETAFRPQSALMRISVNGRDVGVAHIPCEVNSPVSLTGLTFGADLNGQNGAAFDFVANAIYTMTLTSTEKNACANYYARREMERCAVFNGSTWMRRDLSGNLVQQDASLRPLLIDLRSGTAVHEGALSSAEPR